MRDDAPLHRPLSGLSIVLAARTYIEKFRYGRSGSARCLSYREKDRAAHEQRADILLYA